MQGSPSSSNKEQQQQQKRQLHHEVHATKDLPSTSSSSASSSSVSHVHDSPRLLRPERIRRANLHDDFQYSPLVRSPSLKPLAKSAETEFYRGVNLKGPSKEWTVLSTPTESNPTWSIGSGANIQHVTYSEMWKLFNHTATYYTDDDEANLKRLQPQDQSKMKIFSDFVSSHHNSLGLPPPHSSIVIRTAQGGKTEQFFVLRVGDPIGNSTRHEFKIVSTTGSVLTVQLDETEKYDSESSIEASTNCGWAVLRGGCTCYLEPPAECNVTTNLSLKCPLCDYSSSSSMIALRAHVNTVHASLLTTPETAQKIASMDRTVACDHCHKLFDKGGVKTHSNACPDRPVTCPVPTCQQQMRGKGAVATQHLTCHLKTEHSSANDDQQFTSETAKLFEKHSFLQMCSCSNHSIGALGIERLYTKATIRLHLAPPNDKEKRFGSGPKWAMAHAFISRMCDTLDPESNSFQPLSMANRAKPFDYYNLPYYVISKALTVFTTIATNLVKLSPDDVSGEYVSLWFLIHFYDAIIFSGDKDIHSNNRRKVAAIVNARVQRLVDGDIEELWKSAFPPPLPHKESAEGDPDVKRKNRVNFLIKNSRFSDATSTATANLVGLQMNDSGVLEFAKAVNPAVIKDDDLPGIQRRAHRPPTEVDPLLFAPDMSEELDDDGKQMPDPGLLKLKDAILSTPKGKALGYAGDSMDFWRRIADNSGKNGEDLEPFLEIVRRVMRGQMPQAIRPCYNLIVGCLFAKPGSNPVAYRPIGIPTALYRLVGKFFCREVAEEMAKLLLEVDQYAIGVPAGMAILLGSLELMVQSSINLDKEPEGPTAQKALLSLDLTSMFNALNLDTFFDECDKEEVLRKYLPFFETCFRNDTTYVLQKCDGTVAHVRQKQGGAQGSNVVPLMAAISLRRLIKEFHQSNLPPHLKPHTAESIASIVIRLHNADGTPRAEEAINIDREAVKCFKRQLKLFTMGRGASITCYMDDISLVASYTYIIKFARFLNERGPTVGAYVNWAKVQLLLGNRWDDKWRDQNENGVIETDIDIRKAFRNLGVPLLNIISCAEDGPTSLAKVKGGIKLLGSFIGFSEGIETFRRKVLANQVQAFEAVVRYVPDKNSRSALVRLCILPKTNHMFATAPNRNGTETFANECHDKVKSFFERLYVDGKSLDSETSESFNLATLLPRQGGINFSSPKNSYLAAYVATWARVLAAASRPPQENANSNNQTAPHPVKGFFSREGKRIGEPHPSIQKVVDEQIKQPTLRCIKDFYETVNDICASNVETVGKEIACSKGPEGIIEKGAAPMLQHAITSALMANKTQEIYSRLCEQEKASGEHSHLRQIMPSSAQPMGTAFLENLRMSGERKVSSEAHHIGVCAKLGLPLLNIPKGESRKCELCGKQNTVNRFGMHIFECSRTWQQRTVALHNPLRDTFALVLKQLQGVGSDKAQFGNVKLEAKGLVSGSASRPADILFCLKQPLTVLDEAGEKIENITKIAVDLTITQLTRTEPIPGVKNEAVWYPSTFQHLINAEEVKRVFKHNGDTPKGTANYLATQGIGFLPAALDVYGGMGSSLAGFLYGSVVATKMQNKTKVFTSDHFEQAGWITEGGNWSDKTSDYSVPFLPKELIDQLRAASKKAKEDARESGEKPDDKYYFEGSTERDAVQRISTTRVEGAAIIVAYYNMATVSVGGTDVMRNPDFEKIRNKMLATVEKMQANEGENDSETSEETNENGVREWSDDSVCSRGKRGRERGGRHLSDVRDEGIGETKVADDYTDLLRKTNLREHEEIASRDWASTVATRDELEDSKFGEDFTADWHSFEGAEDDFDDDDVAEHKRWCEAGKPALNRKTRHDGKVIYVPASPQPGSIKRASNERSAQGREAEITNVPPTVREELPEHSESYEERAASLPPREIENTRVSGDDREYIVGCFQGDIIGGAERATRFKEIEIEIITELISDEEWDARMKKRRAAWEAERELEDMSSNLESLSLAHQQNDLESMEGIMGSNASLRREYRSLSGGGPEGLNQTNDV